MDPFTLFLQTATPLAAAFIEIAPEIIRTAAKSKKKKEALQSEQEQQQLQRNLEHLRREFQAEQLKNQQQIQTYQDQARKLGATEAAGTRAKSETERKRWETYWEQLRQQRQLEQQIAIYNRQNRLELAEIQRQTALQLPEVNKLFENWPLTIVPSQILSAQRHKNLTPLRIFLSPPTVQFERFSQIKHDLPEVEPRLAQSLREFLDEHYSLQDATRPTEFLGGAWDSKRARGEASIRALFSMLKSEPALVLETEIMDQHEMSFRLGYWGLGQEAYCYQSITKLPYREIMCGFARTRALKWKERKQRLLEQELTPGEISRIGGENELNLQVFEGEERLRAMGEDPYELQIYLNYRLNHQDFEEFCKILSICHCLVAGWITDAYYYIYYDISPLLPKLIQEVTNKVSAPQALQPIIQGVVTGYRMIFDSLINERPLWLPEMSLQLAQSLSSLPDKSWAREQAYYSVKSCLKQRNVLSPPEGVESLEIFQAVLTLADQPYIENLKICFSSFGDASVKSKLLDLDWRLKRQQKELEAQYKKGVEHVQVGNYREAIANFSHAIQLNPSHVEAYFSRGYVYAQAGNLEQAIADYGRALQLKSEYLEAYVNRGNAYYKIGNYELAIKDYNQALLLNPNLIKVTKHRDDAQRTLESQKR